MSILPTSESLGVSVFLYSSSQGTGAVICPEEFLPGIEVEPLRASGSTSRSECPPRYRRTT